jgi:hypothetical protein
MMEARRRAEGKTPPHPASLQSRGRSANPCPVNHGSSEVIMPHGFAGQAPDVRFAEAITWSKQSRHALPPHRSAAAFQGLLVRTGLMQDESRRSDPAPRLFRGDC